MEIQDFRLIATMRENAVSVSMSHLWRYGVHPGAVFVAFVVDKAQLAEQHRKHPKVLLEFPQSVLVGIGVVSDSIRKLRSTTEKTMC